MTGLPTRLLATLATLDQPAPLWLLRQALSCDRAEIAAALKALEHAGMAERQRAGPGRQLAAITQHGRQAYGLLGEAA